MLKLFLLFTCLSSMAYSQVNIDTETTLYGFTAFPYDLTLEALETTHDLVVENSSLYAVHRDDGCVPWQEALNDTAFPEWLTSDWTETKGRIPADMPISLHITPTKNDRYTLADQCGNAEGEAGTMPAVLEGKPYNDPQLMTAYLNYARRFADIFKPTFFTIAIEMGELSRIRPDEWKNFVTLTTSTLEGLRSSHPQIKLGVEFVLQTLMVPQVAKQVQPFLDQLDFLGISFYPYGSEFGEFYGVPALPQPPAQWLEPLRWLRTYTGKPIAVVETGYTTKDRRVNGINFPGNEALQASYLKDLLQIAREDHYLFVVWFVPVDYEKLLEKLPDSENKKAANIWVNAGLLDNDLNPKPAWAVWQEFAIEGLTPAQADTSSPASSLPLLGPGLHLGTTFYSSGRVPEDQETLSAVNEAVTAGMNAFHFNVDWPELEPIQGVYNLTELETTLSWLQSQGLVPLLNITLVDINQLNLPAGYLNEAGNLAAGVQFSDPIFIKRFNQLLDKVVPLLIEYNGFYLGVGNEIDERFSEYPEELGLYLEFVAAVREHVHGLEPQLAVGVTLTSQGVLNEAMFSQLKKVTDVMPFNYYPIDYDFKVKDFSLIPADFKTLITAYGDSPIMIQELGCPSAEVMNSSAQQQQRCFEEMFAALAVYPQIRFISVFSFQDFDQETCEVIATYFDLEQFVAEGLPAEFVERFRAYLCTLGLRNADGSAKLAWQAFLNQLERINTDE